MRCILLVNTEVATTALTKFSTLRALGSTEASYAGLAAKVSKSPRRNVERIRTICAGQVLFAQLQTLLKSLRFAAPKVLGRNEWAL